MPLGGEGLDRGRRIGRLVLRDLPTRLEPLSTEIGEHVIGVPQRDRPEPVAKAVGLEQEDKLAVVNPGNTRDRDARAALLAKQIVQSAPQFIDAGPVDLAGAKDERLADDAGPRLWFKRRQRRGRVDRVDL